MLEINKPVTKNISNERVFLIGYNLLGHYSHFRILKGGSVLRIAMP